MNLSFYGAAKTVSGSCFLLETNKIKILIDCGMFQGGKKLNGINFLEFPFNPSEIDYLLLTHAHIDHSGRIPLLYKKGFKGKIITTKATYNLCSVMLLDSAHIQENEATWRNRKRIRKGMEIIDPLYTIDDANKSILLFDPIQYNKNINLSEDIRVCFRDSGHMLGSAIIELWHKENNQEYKYVFTGDLGNINKPILKDPTIIKKTDFLIIESTYGDRNHENNNNSKFQLLQIILDTAKKGGNVIIPSFAVGRTQEILYEINYYKENKLLDKYQDIPVIVDSPLAIRATEIFKENYHLFDQEAKSLIAKGDDPLVFENLKYSLTAEESKEINENRDSKIIISASGMCDAGRIRHHLKHNIWKENSSIVFVGYQAEGSIGRRIIEGEKEIKLFGEEIRVNASIYNIDSYSGHADFNGLINWLESYEKIPKKIILVHGEEDSIINLSKEINKKFFSKIIIPNLGDTYKLTQEIEFINNIDYTKALAKTGPNERIYNQFDILINKLSRSKINDVKYDKIQYYLQQINHIIDDE